ncbi:MAG TPA: hypothetical protein P5565_13385 [Bacteroidia bacterium]|nr:hypothetical protein [Bacteroidia bacterium]
MRHEAGIEWALKPNGQVRNLRVHFEHEHALLTDDRHEFIAYFNEIKSILSSFRKQCNYRA